MFNIEPPKTKLINSDSVAGVSCYKHKGHLFLFESYGMSGTLFDEDRKELGTILINHSNQNLGPQLPLIVSGSIHVINNPLAIGVYEQIGEEPYKVTPYSSKGKESDKTEEIHPLDYLLRFINSSNPK